MFTKLLRRTQEEKGFTLIELLVVILIIGILAAIAIPAFLNQKGKAYDSNAKSDARTAATAQETYFTDNNAYAGAAAGLASLVAIEPTLSQATPAPPAGESLTVDAPASGLYGATVVGTPTAANSYDVKLTSKSGVKYAYIRWPDGTVSRTCDTSGAANASGCKIVSGTTGTW
jgi:type IV pilus assembly protein PilA